jgi:hypothetical protein
MQSWSYRKLGVVLGTLAMLLGAGWAWAGTPQTIVIDGVNDFDIGNRIDQDGGDTQNPEIDYLDVYLTNDANKLYIGMEHDKGVWSTVQLGIAIDVNTPAGGTTDPWGRQIEWSLAPNKPDYMFYVNLDNNWQGGYEWDGADWQQIVPQGPNALGWKASTAFKELAVLLTTLGVSSGNTINVEMWITQEGGTKGPLDCVVNDALQLSTPTFTLWDTATPIPLTDMYAYVVQAAADPDPPVVEKTANDNSGSTDFPAESFFDVFFNEPVDQTTSQVTTNYSLSGGDGVPHTVVTATRDGSQLNIVHLETSPGMTESANLYQLTVTNVQDLAGNPIVNNGTTNVACFQEKFALFRGRFSQYLAAHADPPDTFTIEGDFSPLTFTPLCDTGFMTDSGVDDIWEWRNLFHISGDCGAGTASQELLWKFAHECTTFEPLASNRQHTFDLATGARDTLDFWWGDEDPTQFTTHPVDVEFFVDMSVYGYVPDDTVAVNGSVAPLNFNVPSDNELADDGSGNDATPGDGIYSTVMRFPTGSRKDVAYKYVLNSEYECFGQGDRNVYLNDAEFDTVGGALGPITLPKVHFDRCSAIWRAVEVVFAVDLNNTAYAGVDANDVLSVNGTLSNSEPATFSWDVPSINPMRDDGQYPDNAAGDKVYKTAVVFADSSWINTEYKYLLNDVYECVGQSNRFFTVDADNHDAVGNPQILPTDRFQICEVVDVIPLPGRGLALRQNAPNPFNPKTEIRYIIHQPGQGTLRVYSLRGELVRTLYSGHFEAGEGVSMWDGRADSGEMAGSGVYIYRLEVNGQADSRQMLLIK